MAKSTIYVRLHDGTVGTLYNINSSDPGGKYGVDVKGASGPKRFADIHSRITAQEYAAYETPQPTKQPAKRSKKS